MKSLRAILRIIAFIVLNIALIPFQIVILIFSRSNAAYILPHAYHKITCALFGISAQIIGKPHIKSQTLYASNHLSYFDIIALNAIIPRVSFVAKKDVARWPVWGFLAKLQQTAFISRGRKDAKAEAMALNALLKSGKNLLIFPEGTSTDGLSVLDFKSSLFDIAMAPDAKNLSIQPITIKVVRIDGAAPKTQDQRDIYAWHRDMDTVLPAHLWAYAKTKGVILQITFHSILRAKDFNDRKTLAKACHQAVCKGL